MDMRTSYFEDITLFKDRSVGIWSLLALSALIALPFLLAGYQIFVVNLVLINVIIVLGLNVLIGNTGQISLGHGGFVAIGAYMTVILDGSLPFLLALILAAIIAAAFGVLLGIPSLKLEGPYLAVATLGFGLAITVIIGRVRFFGGHMGLIPPQLEIFGLSIGSNTQFYFLCLILALIMGVFARLVIGSRIGRAFSAIRDSDIAASALGVNVVRYKIMSFAFSAFYAGIGGGIWAYALGFISPGVFAPTLSILLLSMVVVGGLGTITGSVLGATVVTLLNLQSEKIIELPVLGAFFEWFSATFMSVSGLPNINWVFMGLTIILIILFEPYGLFGIWMRIKIYFKTWPF